MIELMHGLSFLSPLLLIIGVIIGAIYFEKNSLECKLIFFYFIAALAVDILSRYMGLISGNKNNLILLSISGIVDLSFFYLLYSKFYNRANQVFLRIITLAALLAVGYLLFDKTFKATSKFDSYDKVICDGVILIYALMSMFNLLKNKAKLRKEVIRINASVLLFFSLDLLFSLVSNFLINAGLNFVIYFWLLRLALLLTLYIVLIQTLWQTGKNQRHLQYG